MSETLPNRQAAAPTEEAEARTTRRRVPSPPPALAPIHTARRRVVGEPEGEITPAARRSSMRLIDWAKRYLQARGLYRVYNAAAYRFYRSNSGPPAEGDSPFATATTIDATPEVTFADGTWWLSVSYFNGVVDSGFLPIGANGETYRVLVVAGGVGAGTPPSAPLDVRLELRAGGVVRVVALYAQEGDDRATLWSVGYTVDGSTPAEDTPTATQAFARTSGVEVLVYDVPAQAHGTTVKVRVQVRRGASTYSDGSSVLTAIADATGPAQIPGGELWSGALPEEVL